MARVEGAIRFLTEWAVALLLVIEMGILLVGVTSRYVLNRPLPWSDELAADLFLWIAMFGAVIAVQRGQHMRILLLFRRLAPRQQARLETLAALIALMLFSVLAWLGVRHTLAEMPVNTFTLEISRAWRAAALPASFLLMAILSAFQLSARRGQGLWPALVLLAAVIGGLWAAAPLLDAVGNLNLIVFFVLLVGAGVFGGIPIGIVFLFGTRRARAAPARPNCR